MEITSQSKIILRTRHDSRKTKAIEQRKYIFETKNGPQENEPRFSDTHTVPREAEIRKIFEASIPVFHSNSICPYHTSVSTEIVNVFWGEITQDKSWVCDTTEKYFHSHSFSISFFHSSSLSLHRRRKGRIRRLEGATGKKETGESEWNQSVNHTHTDRQTPLLVSGVRCHHPHYYTNVVRLSQEIIRMYFSVSFFSYFIWDPLVFLLKFFVIVSTLVLFSFFVCLIAAYECISLTRTVFFFGASIIARPPGTLSSAPPCCGSPRGCSPRGPGDHRRTCRRSVCPPSSE